MDSELENQYEFKKTFFSSEKQRILNVFENFLKESVSANKAVQKAAIYLKVSTRSIWRIIKEKRTQKVLSSPKKPPGRSLLLDDFEKNAIRRKVHSFFFRNEVPTLDKLYSEVRSDEDLPKLADLVYIQV